jgi:hypothetical protein
MKAWRAAASTLVLLAVALGVAACGGPSAATKTHAAEAKALEARWSAGLHRWRHSMQIALDGISVLFSREVTLMSLTERRSSASHRLAGYESTLSRCSLALDGLGPVPPTLVLAARYAGQACTDLEKGAVLVRKAVIGLVNNTLVDPMDPLTDASVPLGAGQSEIVTATAALTLPPS